MRRRCERRRRRAPRGSPAGTITHKPPRPAASDTGSRNGREASTTETRAAVSAVGVMRYRLLSSASTQTSVPVVVAAWSGATPEPTATVRSIPRSLDRNAVTARSRTTHRVSAPDANATGAPASPVTGIDIGAPAVPSTPSRATVSSCPVSPSANVPWREVATHVRVALESSAMRARTASVRASSAVTSLGPVTSHSVLAVAAMLSRPGAAHRVSFGPSTIRFVRASRRPTRPDRASYMYTAADVGALSTFPNVGRPRRFDAPVPLGSTRTVSNPNSQTAAGSTRAPTTTSGASLAADEAGSRERGRGRSATRARV